MEELKIKHEIKPNKEAIKIIAMRVAETIKRDRADFFVGTKQASIAAAIRAGIVAFCNANNKCYGVVAEINSIL